MPSNSQIDAAGDRLRRYIRGETTDFRYEDVRTVQAFRAEFSNALKLVTVGVRQFVERESSFVVVAQRHKRFISMIEKLEREERMRLTQMQDIGGCRAVLPGGKAEIQGVLRRIRRNRWNIKRHIDYISSPRSTGYRAVHVVVLRRDPRREERAEKLIEIQLRTPLQHEWAEAVESWGARLGYDLKNGAGPPELVRYFERAAVMLESREEGVALASEFFEEFEELRFQVEAYFGE